MKFFIKRAIWDASTDHPMSFRGLNSVLEEMLTGIAERYQISLDGRDINLDERNLVDNMCARDALKSVLENTDCHKGKIMDKKENIIGTFMVYLGIDVIFENQEPYFRLKEILGRPSGVELGIKGGEEGNGTYYFQEEEVRMFEKKFGIQENK